MKTYREFLTDSFAKPAIVAHRGDWQNAPENSLRAIQKAATQGIEIAEIDIRKSGDGVFFLMHDDTLKRTAGRPEQCEDLSWEDLSRIPLYDRDGSGDLTQDTIPSLAQALEVARGKIYLDIDVKNFEHMAEVAKLIAEAEMTNHVDIKVPVQSRAEAEGLRQLEEQYGVMVMPKTRFLGETADEQIALLAEIGAAVVETKFSELEVITSRQEQFHAAGIAVWVNTLDPVACCDLTDTRAVQDPDEIWGKLMQAGVSIFQTDALAELVAYRAGLVQS